ncbi:lytic transglycosylase domain-containing protein [Demequina silvatica]|uniref:lytic transglycosylase domain-containing protein n=1 Tax=Demequina silvatica TaxID=1638988 RepID=UPI000781EF63|nr:lytic transglycosylase domain-containing protein [Demequina silvatica]
MAASTASIPAARAVTTAAIVTALGFTTTAPAVADERHRVREGDTVSDLAHRYGSTIPAIVAANGLDSRATIYVGTTVTVPTKGGSAQASTPTLSATYTVRSGDTLSEIAHRHGTTVAALARENSLANAGLIYPGQRLTIGGSGKATPVSTSSTGAARSGSTHTVEAGDTLSELAQRHGTTVAAIARANNLPNASFIAVGQRLTIPGSGAGTMASASTPSTTTAATAVYTVRAGDTLSAIAQRHGTTVATLARANTLANASTIYVGQRLRISGAGSAKPASGLVGDTFAGRTYARDIVSAANINKATLLERWVPSRDSMQALVVSTARRYGVDPALAQAISYQESGFDMRAVSPANAVGVMQVIPTSGDWASDMAGRRLDLLDPEDNVTAGILILRYLTRSFSSVDDAIAGYYQGAAAVRDHGYHSDTVDYVASVKALMTRFG